jgi:hypothetical protein
VDGDSTSTNERGPSLVGSVPVKRLLSYLGCSSQLSTKSVSNYVSPSPRNLGRQSCRAACLLMCVSVNPLSLLFVCIAYPGESGIPGQLVDSVIVVNVEIAGEQGPG